MVRLRQAHDGFHEAGTCGECDRSGTALPRRPRRPGGEMTNTGGFGARNETIEANNDPCADLRARIEELEAALNGISAKYNEKEAYLQQVESENARLRKLLHSLGPSSQHLAAENARLREALGKIAATESPWYTARAALEEVSL